MCRLKSVVVEREGQLGQGGREEEEGEERDEQSGECIASFPGLPTIQFSVFDRLQYAKTEGKGLISFIM